LKARRGASKGKGSRREEGEGRREEGGGR